jgi:hypothetical protein
MTRLLPRKPSPLRQSRQTPAAYWFSPPPAATLAGAAAATAGQVSALPLLRSISTLLRAIAGAAGRRHEPACSHCCRSLPLAACSRSLPLACVLLQELVKRGDDSRAALASPLACAGAPWTDAGVAEYFTAARQLLAQPEFAAAAAEAAARRPGPAEPAGVFTLEETRHQAP